MDFSQDIFRLSCDIKHYDWGMRQKDDVRPYIASLLGLEAEPDQPYAELWMGAHENAPSKLIQDGDEPVMLNEAIRGHTSEILGPSLEKRGIKELPFLFKILSCEQPLSIQAHPDKELAYKLHQQDPEHYPDANHKPELAVALTPFKALCQFRTAAEIYEELNRYDSLRMFFSEAVEKYDQRPSDQEWIKRAYRKIFDATDEEITGVLGVLAAELKRTDAPTPADQCFQVVAASHPGDRGLLSVYFLNYLRLQPGQAFAMAANEPHAYLEGTILECMANSDNVVRAGLTGKHIDSEILLDMLSFTGQSPAIDDGEVMADGERRYRFPVPEFQIEEWCHNFGEKKVYSSRGAVSILLVLAGQAEFRTPAGKTLASTGGVFLWPGALGEVELFYIDDNTRIIRATVDEELGIPAAEEEQTVVHADAEVPGADQLTSESAETAASTETEAAPETTASEVSAESAAEASAGEPDGAEEKPAQSVVELDEDEAADFAARLDAGMREIKTNVEPGQKIEGTISAIDSGTVYVDIGSRSEGVLDKSQVTEDDGTLSVHVGDRIETYCISIEEDQVHLARHLEDGAGDAEALRDAYQSGIPVEGKVTEECKGGFSVSIGGQRAFCPYSQIDIQRRDATECTGQDFSFLITEFSEGGRNIVVSRRKLLEQEREQKQHELQEQLNIGDRVTGKVRSIMPFGVFVDLGGIDGLIPLRELSWDRQVDPNDVVSEGDSVSVVVQNVDWQNQRITLSLKYAQGDPWAEIEDKYHTGGRHKGKVTNLAPFGAFVQLEPGIEGLLHISKMAAGRPINHPGEVLKEGDEVEVSIERIDTEQRRISLSMEDAAATGKTTQPEHAAAKPEPVPEVKEGNVVTGEVDGIREFGIFVRLPDGRTGLLHVSEADVKGAANPRKEMFDNYPPGSTVQVRIKSIKGDRISLARSGPSGGEGHGDEAVTSQQTFQDTPGGNFGNLGDLLGDLDLDKNADK